ncbi:hypothetical protein [Limnochorda pilosa]|uniref:ECF transporter S component n=1 Tax=Limnochorda pilosa TaxID=1555112 RepID=A0A0K2SI86_LIMPI|nr:hypothetical protein [Limnochorda pilosa]BAS26727.1 hypothetical protein LIP_0870 [Limnochorda pilosa]
MEGRSISAEAGHALAANSYHLLRSALLLVLAVAVQLLGWPQLITGTVVNAVLLAAALTSPPLYGASVGVLTPVVALARGIIPPPAAPMVPFIAAGNALLVLVFWGFHRAGRRFGWRWASWLGAGVAAALKAAFLGYAATHLVTVPAPVAGMMQGPQLVTALAGAVMVLGLGPAVQQGLGRLFGWASPRVSP